MEEIDPSFQKTNFTNVAVTIVCLAIFLFIIISYIINDLASPPFMIAEMRKVFSIYADGLWLGLGLRLKSTYHSYM